MEKIPTKEQIEETNVELKAMIEGMDKIIPVARKYLNEIRDIRMAFDREIIEIVRSGRQLNEIAKHNGTLIELGLSLQKIVEILEKRDIVDLLNETFNMSRIQK